MSGELIKLAVAVSVGAVVAWRLTARRRTVPRKPQVRRGYKGQRTVTEIAGRLERERARSPQPRPGVSVVFPPTVRIFDDPAVLGFGHIATWPATPEQGVVQVTVDGCPEPRTNPEPAPADDLGQSDDPLSYTHLASVAQRLGFRWDREQHELLTGLLARGRSSTGDESAESNDGAEAADTSPERAA